MKNPITSDNIIILQKELVDVLVLIEKETKNKYPSFYSYLNIMNKNVEICIKCNFDGINDLYKYLLEDWREVFDENARIINWKIYKDEIDDMAFCNRTFFAKIEKIDKILNANMYIARRWIDRAMIKEMAISFSIYRGSWEASIEWFSSEIPAFYDAKPIDIVKNPYGDDALRALMMTIPF